MEHSTNRDLQASAAKTRKTTKKGKNSEILDNRRQHKNRKKAKLAKGAKTTRLGNTGDNATTRNTCRPWSPLHQFLQLALFDAQTCLVGIATLFNPSKMPNSVSDASWCHVFCLVLAGRCHLHFTVFSYQTCVKEMKDPAYVRWGQRPSGGSLSISKQNPCSYQESHVGVVFGP